MDAVGSDAERAELLTVLVDDGSRWLGELRQRRDEAIMEALASGFTPRQLATRLRMSKTQIVNVRHRYLRDLESIGAQTKDIVYRSSGGLVTYVNDAYRQVTGVDPATSSAVRPRHSGTRTSRPSSCRSGTRRSGAASGGSGTRSGCGRRTAAGPGSTWTSRS